MQLEKTIGRCESTGSDMEERGIECRPRTDHGISS